MKSPEKNSNIPPEVILHALNWRYATKQFDPQRKIPEEVWDALEQSLVLAPSSFGVQPWKFIVVDDPDLRTKLREASWGQAQVVDGSRVVVFTVRSELSEQDVDRFIARTAEVRGSSVESLKGYRDVIVGFINGPMHGTSQAEWGARQAYIALGQFMTSAAVLGVDTCPMEGIAPKDYDKVLGLEGSGYHTVCACVAGYRADGDKYATTPKVRYPRDEVVDRR